MKASNREVQGFYGVVFGAGYVGCDFGFGVVGGYV